MVPRLMAQSAAAPFKVNGLSQMTLTVSDVKRSLAFYQGLFGMPIQARQGSTLFLRIGAGPRFLALKQAGAGEHPSISALGMGVEDFSVDRVVRVLAARGLTRLPSNPSEVFVADPGGVALQLHDVPYCGGGGLAGNDCTAVEPSQSKGLIAVREIGRAHV